MIPDLLTPLEVAKKLKVDDDTVRRLADAQQIEYTKVGKQYRFTTEAIEAYLKSRTVKPKNNKFLKQTA